MLLHLTPALLLIALTETIAAYRRTVTDLLDRIGPTDPTERPTPPAAVPTRSATRGAEPIVTVPDPPADPPAHSRSGHTLTATGGTPPPSPNHTGPHTPASPPPTPLSAPTPPPPDNTAAHRDVWPRAIALDDAARAATGKPVSIWKLRTDLRVGPHRARQIRDQLLSRRTDPPPASS